MDGGIGGIVMCGIAGIINLTGVPVDPSSLDAMSQIQRHRGPDDTGSFVDGNVGLGHCRLSIIDLSPAGHQPMTDDSGRFCITYNGEVYNYIELREELQSYGHVFRTGTDTEVILHAYREWGKDCLKRFNGMFAFAIYDKSNRSLFCARDRLGVKPFYYWFNQNRFVFASEIKSILTQSQVPRRPNYRLMFDFLAYWQLDHTDETFFESIVALPAAHWMIVDDRGLQSGSYWSLDSAKQERARQDLTSHMRLLLEDAIRLRLRSDVPVGSCLSGGLDSSSIVCVCSRQLQECHPDPNVNGHSQHRTFSAYYEEPSLDERPFIREVVHRTGVEADYILVRPSDLPSELTKLIWHQEQPIGGWGVFAQWQVMKSVASSGVKVLLDGQGGDELLAGYESFYPAQLAQLLRTFRWIEYLRMLQSLAARNGQSALSRVQGSVLELLPDSFRYRMKQRLNRLAPPWLDRHFSASHFRPMQPVDNPYSCRLHRRLCEALLSRSLPSLLRYEDRNSMAFSIETRAPFLDFRLVEFAFALPAEYKLRSTTTKAILRDAMRGIVPDAVLDREDKIGFVAPDGKWLRDELKELAGDLLHSQRFLSRGIFDAAQMRNEFDALQNGDLGRADSIGRAVNTELWLQQFIDR